MQWAASALQKPNILYGSLDDDIVVHVPNLVAHVKTKFFDSRMCDADTRRKYRPCFEDLPLLCVYSYQTKDIPSREDNSKWFISVDDFPGSTWPVYCRGGMYIAPVKMIDDLFRISRRTEVLFLDDVWITGFLRSKLGMGDINIVVSKCPSVYCDLWIFCQFCYIVKLSHAILVRCLQKATKAKSDMLVVFKIGFWNDLRDVTVDWNVNYIA